MKITHHLNLRFFADIITEVKKTLSHPFASDASMLAASQYLAMGLGFIKTAVAARLLGPKDFGLVTLVMAYPTLILSIFAVKSRSVTTRYLAGMRANKNYEEFLSTCRLGYTLDFCVSSVAFLLVMASSGWVAQTFYHLPQLSGLMVAYAACLPFVSLDSTSRAILTTWQKFRWLALLQLSEPILGLFLVTALLLLGYGVAGMVVAIALSMALSATIMLAVATRFLHMAGLGRWWRASFQTITLLRREFTKFFAWNYLVVSLDGLIIQVPLMLLGRFQGPLIAGYFRLALNLSMVGSYLEVALSRVTYPVISARWQKGDCGSLLASLRRWTLYGGLPSCLILLVSEPILPFLIPLIFGEAYRPMVPAAQLLLAGTAISVLFFWLQPVYYATARIDIFSKVYFIYTLFNLLLAYIAIAFFGLFELCASIALLKIIYIIGSLLLISQIYQPDNKLIATH